MRMAPAATTWCRWRRWGSLTTTCGRPRSAWWTCLASCRGARTCAAPPSPHPSFFPFRACALRLAPCVLRPVARAPAWMLLLPEAVPVTVSVADLEVLVQCLPMRHRSLCAVLRTLALRCHELWRGWRAGNVVNVGCAVRGLQPATPSACVCACADVCRRQVPGCAASAGRVPSVPHRPPPAPAHVRPRGPWSH
jgi:hypothetical protein